MDYQTEKEDLIGVTRFEASNELGVPENQLTYYAWPQLFGSTAGPFGGIGGQAMSTFTIEAWTDGRRAIIFCKGKPIKITDQFRPLMQVRE